MTKILSSYAVHTAAKMPSPPPAPLPSMSTGHRFIPSAREAGECKAYLRYVFRVEGNLAPPPLLKGGEGVRGRDGTFGL